MLTQTNSSWVASSFQVLVTVYVVLMSLTASASARSALSDGAYSVFPRPNNVVVNNTKPVHFQCVRFVGSSTGYIESAAQRFSYKLRTLHPAIDSEEAGAKECLRISIQSEDTSDGIPSLESREDYRIHISEDGVQISSTEVWGALHALHTLIQLVENQREGGALQLPQLSIQDSPLYPWRGMLLDVVRHWFTVGEVLRLVEQMALVKLNVLHLHLSDDQGFRVDVQSLPKLKSEKHYSAEDINTIVSFAAQRGVRVVPEFGLPGHSRAWQQAYPQISVPDATNNGGLASLVFPPPVDPTSEELYRMLSKVIGDLSGLFPDRFWHIGGDETNTASWESSESIQAFMADNQIEGTESLQAYFAARYISILMKHGKTAIAWDEMAASELPEDTVFHVWRDDNGELPSGNRLLVSNGYYLDQFYSSWTMYQESPHHKLSSYREEDLLPVLGGEIANWSESMDGSTLDLRTWPRAAVVAELFWTREDALLRNDKDLLYARLQRFSNFMAGLGSRHLDIPKVFLAELAVNGGSKALQELAAVIEPTPLYNLEELKTLEVLLALIKFWWTENEQALHQRMFFIGGFADYLPGESLLAHDFGRLVDRYVATGRGHETIAEYFSDWIALEARVRFAVGVNPTLDGDGILELAKGLATVSRIGLACLRLHENDRKPDSRELEHWHSEFERYGPPPQIDLSGWEWWRDWRPIGLRKHRIAVLPHVNHLCDFSVGLDRVSPS